MDERRRFERVNIPDSARLHVTDTSRKKLGKLKILGRGGMLFACEVPYTPGTRHAFRICDDIEGISRTVNTVIRYFTADGVACQFEKLDSDAAVDIGVWIGKFYSSRI